MVKRLVLILLPLLVTLAGCEGAGGALGGTGDDDDVDSPSEAEETARSLYAIDHIVEIAIEIAPDDASSLAEETNSLFGLLEGEDCMDEPWSGPFNWYPADITVDGEQVLNVGVRKKGLIGSLSTTKPSLKVKFDKFEPEQRLGGLERLTLNNSVSDPTLVKQCLGYQLFADAGLASPRCNFAHVTVNGSDLGVFVNVEPLKKTFLSAAFEGDDDGDLYEGTLSDFREGWTGTFEAETSDSDSSLAPIHEVRDALALADDADAFAALDAGMDIERFRTFWALEVLVGHQDGYTGNRNNFYVYRPEGTGRLEFLPWGIDVIFRDGGGQDGQSANVVFANSLLPRRLWDNPGQRALYLTEVERLLDEVWDADGLQRELDRMLELVEPLAVLPQSYEEQVAGLQDFIAARESTMRAALGEELPEFEQPLADSPCLIYAGELRVEFETTFGTLGADAPLDEGSSRMTGVYEGVEFDLSGGAVGGLNEGRVVVATQALTSATKMVQSVAVVPWWELDKDPVPLGGFGSQAYLLSLDFSTEPGIQTVLGSLWEAELSFEQLTGDPGSPLSGRWEGPIYANGQ